MRIVSVVSAHKHRSAPAVMATLELALEKALRMSVAVLGERLSSGKDSRSICIFDQGGQKKGRDPKN